jgi:hypothetical protein
LVVIVYRAAPPSKRGSGTVCPSYFAYEGSEPIA